MSESLDAAAKQWSAATLRSFRSETSSGIDLTREVPIPLRQVPKLPQIPKGEGGKPPHISKIYRWVQRGIRGVRLEVIQCGGTKCTTVEAIGRFFARLSAHNSPPLIQAKPPALRERQIESACAKLKDLLGGAAK